MDVTVLGTVFATYYPMIILFFFFGSMFHVITRILALFNIKRFRYYDDKFIANDSQIVEGKSLVQRGLCFRPWFFFCQGPNTSQERIKRHREGGFANNFSKGKLTDRHPLLSNSDSHVDGRGSSSYNVLVVVLTELRTCWLTPFIIDSSCALGTVVTNSWPQRELGQDEICFFHSRDDDLEYQQFSLS